MSINNTGDTRRAFRSADMSPEHRKMMEDSQYEPALKRLSINNEADYSIALKRLSIIFQAGKGTPEGEELVTLAQLIYDYEEEHFPIK